MPQKITLKDSLLAILTGLLLIFSFPKWDNEWLAWIAFIPLFLALEKKTPARAFLLGWISGFVFFFGSLNWIITTIVTYGQIPWIIGFLAFLFMVLILACYTGAFAWGITTCALHLPLPRMVYAPVLWTALEFIRGHFFLPFPWASLGYSQYLQLPLIQIADMTSVYGVSFLILLVNTVLSEFVLIFYFHGKEEKPRFPFSWRPVIITFFIVLGVLVYGKTKLVLSGGNEKTVKLSVIQGNIEQGKKWDEKYRNDTLAEYERLSTEAAQNRPDLIVWPETAVPFLYERELKYREGLIQFVKTLHTPVLFGSPSIDPSPAGDEWFNSAYLLNSDGVPAGRYDKINLVPFGEYVPFHPLLFFVNKLTDGIGDFKRGKEPTVFALAGHPAGTLICFEVIFPELFRQFVDKGAVVMTTITNDAWFGATSAPYQHFSMVVFRAIENRTPVARAANTGISGFIDSRGRILETTRLFVPAQLTHELKYYGERTFYTRYGDVFGWSIVTAGLLMVGFTWWKRKNHVR
jgi:apolipoprotein N-acyltransferase